MLPDPDQLAALTQGAGAIPGHGQDLAGDSDPQSNVGPPQMLPGSQINPGQAAPGGPAPGTGGNTTGGGAGQAVGSNLEPWSAPPGGWDWPAADAVGGFFGNLWDRATYVPRTVWANTETPDYSLAGRVYVTAGTTVGSVVGVTQVSDAGADHAAVDAHPQSTGEKVVKGVFGVIQLLTAGAGVGLSILKAVAGEAAAEVGAAGAAGAEEAELEAAIEAFEGEGGALASGGAECGESGSRILKGTPDVLHEGPQAARFGDLQGGGEFEFYGKASQGVEGVFRPTGQPGVEIPVSLKSFSEVGKLGNLLNRIGKNCEPSQGCWSEGRNPLRRTYQVHGRPTR